MTSTPSNSQTQKLQHEQLTLSTIANKTAGRKRNTLIVSSEDVNMTKRAKQGNRLFLFPDVIRYLGKWGSSSDLSQLRTLSKNYHEILQPYFLDKLNKSIIVVNKNRGEWPWSPEPNQQQNYAIKTTHFGIEKGILRKHWNTINISHFCRHLKIQDQFSRGFTSILGHHEFENYNYRNRYHSNNISRIVTVQLIQHITTLSLYFLPQYNQYLQVPPETLISNFINQFPKLKTVHLQQVNVDDGPSPRITLAQFKNAIRLIRSQININITIDSNWEETLVTLSFGLEFPNVKYFVNIQRQLQLQEIDLLLAFRNILIKFENLISLGLIKFYLNFGIPNHQFLERVTASVCESQKLIDRLCLVFNTHSADWNRQTDELVTLQCLEQLRPFITELYISSIYSTNLFILWDLLKPLNKTDTVWPNLKVLCLEDYKYPLEILKNCPNLVALSLATIDESLCIFHNGKVHLTKQECIKEYFSKLSKLKRLNLRILSRNFDEVLNKNSKLFSYLKNEVLPLGVKIR